MQLSAAVFARAFTFEDGLLLVVSARAWHVASMERTQRNLPMLIRLYSLYYNRMDDERTTQRKEAQ